VPRTFAAIRKGAWQAPDEKLRSIETQLRQVGMLVRRGSDYDRWDLEVRGGLLAGVRMLLAIEDHGPDTQLVRVRSWPVFSRIGVLLLLLLLALRLGATVDHAPRAALVLGTLALLLWCRKLHEAACSMATVLSTITRDGSKPG
jgi:hypothetical protein